MTRSIVVLCDAIGRDYAEGLARKLLVAGHRVDVVAREKFPVADALPALLHGVCARFDLVIAVIGDSPNAKSWMVPEIDRNESLYPNAKFAAAPGWSEWVARLDESSFRVLQPNGGVVARVEEWIDPAPRPSASPPIGAWVDFDPTWIVRTVRDRLPAREDLADALRACTRTIWDAPFYQSFVGPKLKSSQSPEREALVVKDHVAGLVSIHVAVDGSISALGYLARVVTPS
jgi:hypothetical protein